jgi:RNA polymerase sigma-70 factor (ECF subfamily)
MLKLTDMEQEQQIIAMCKQDLKYFTTIYQWYFLDVYRYAYSLVNDKHKAEDATSQAFMQAIENIRKYEFKGISIKNWLFTIVRNYMYKDYAKEKLSDVISSSEDEDYEQETTLEKLIQDEEQSEIMVRFNALEEHEKEIIRLHLWEEMDFPAIAQVLSSGESKVKMTYYRALKKIS